MSNWIVKGTFVAYVVLAAASVASIVMAVSKMEQDMAKSWMVIVASACALAISLIFMYWFAEVERNRRAMLAAIATMKANAAEGEE